MTPVIPPRRTPNSLPRQGQPAGSADESMPFDHIIVVMMENHSFDNLLGGLSRSGQARADGLTFNGQGLPTNTNPNSAGDPVRSFRLTSTAQKRNVSQSWNDTHKQIDGGRMDGFVTSVNATEPMGYYPPEVLPFAYSLARTFTLANRWFSSVPGPTYPNRRFLLAATAYGDITTSAATLLQGPPRNGTIFDRLDAHGIAWRNYFTHFPMTAVIPSIVEHHPNHLAPIGDFFSDCRHGSLPSVSFVDPGIGVSSEISQALDSLPLLGWLLNGLGVSFGSPGQTEEDPQSMYAGEKWAHGVIEAVLQSPSWPRTLLIYTYDEHGGYYDHVPPPAAIAPDLIPPALGGMDIPGGYDMYGVRVPAVVVSPHSRPNGVTDVVHDHTSVLATIEAKWNLPALTYRDANAATVMDFLDTSQAAMLNPPTIQGPASSGPSGPA
jgi:phospholipase C